MSTGTTATTFNIAINSPVSIGSAALKGVSGLTLSLGTDAEDLDIMATGGMKAYIAGRTDVTISFTLKSSSESEVATIAGHFINKTITTLSADDDVISVSGPFICTKMDANYSAGKVISYSVEYKASYNGSSVSISAST